MIGFKKIIRYLLLSFILLMNASAAAFKPIPPEIDTNPFKDFYNEFVGTLKKEFSKISVEKLFVHYIRRCPCCDDSIDQISLILDALDKSDNRSLIFKQLLFQEQVYNKIIEMENDNLRIREFIKFMKADSFRFNEWDIDLLFNSRLPKLLIDEKNHNIIFKVKLKNWGDNIYMTFSLKPPIDVSVEDSYVII